jgi:D-glycero-alpha-D-manno-heptose-7-phosphate kinase
MIIVQTPLRISLFGGGTDFRSFFCEEGGAVLSSAIDKYIFVTIKKRFDHKLRIGWTRTEMVDNLDQVQHELIREALRMTGIQNGVEITTMGDIPDAGSGLGSSSTVTVGALQAMYTYLGEMVPAEQLADKACQIEIDVLGKPIGIQDQYISALGGFRLIEFGTDGSVHSERVELDPVTSRKMNENLLLFYTGLTRRSASILKEQQANISDRKAHLRHLRDMAYQAHKELLNGNPDAIGEMLDESWQIKKQLASQISNDGIDEKYMAARRAGAVGGKLSGAGGGGFLMLYTPHEKQDAVRAALNGWDELPFRFEQDGSKVIFNYRRD